MSFKTDAQFRLVSEILPARRIIRPWRREPGGPEDTFVRHDVHGTEIVRVYRSASERHAADVYNWKWSDADLSEAAAAVGQHVGFFERWMTPQHSPVAGIEVRHTSLSSIADAILIEQGYAVETVPAVLDTDKLEILREALREVRGGYAGYDVFPSPSGYTIVRGSDADEIKKPAVTAAQAKWTSPPLFREAWERAGLWKIQHANGGSWSIETLQAANGMRLAQPRTVLVHRAKDGTSELLLSYDSTADEFILAPRREVFSHLVEAVRPKQSDRLYDQDVYDLPVPMPPAALLEEIVDASWKIVEKPQSVLPTLVGPSTVALQRNVTGGYTAQYGYGSPNRPNHGMVSFKDLTAMWAEWDDTFRARVGTAVKRPPVYLLQALARGFLVPPENPSIPETPMSATPATAPAPEVPSTFSVASNAYLLAATGKVVTEAEYKLLTIVKGQMKKVWKDLPDHEGYDRMIITLLPLFTREAILRMPEAFPESARKLALQGVDAAIVFQAVKNVDDIGNAIATIAKESFHIFAAIGEMSGGGGFMSMASKIMADPVPEQAAAPPEPVRVARDVTPPATEVAAPSPVGVTS